MRDVQQRFGRVTALDGLSFDVPRGAITVLLGPNGAGKTTAIRLITGAMRPTAGQVHTFGLDPDEDGHLVRPRCGVVSAKPALYDRLTGRENLDYAAALYEVDREEVADRIVSAAARFGIDAALDDLVGGYSTGMKTRLALARSVLHEPELLLFDEPTSGLDPESSYAVLDLIRSMAAEGRTVLMCTHLLAEAEGLADRVVIMERGRDLLAGPPDELARRYWPVQEIRLEAEDPAALDRVAGWQGVASYRRDGELALVALDDPATLPDFVGALVGDGVRLRRVDPHRPTLEDLYFAVRAGRPADTAVPGRRVSPPEMTAAMTVAADAGDRDADRLDEWLVPAPDSPAALDGTTPAGRDAAPAHPHREGAR
ncbi:MAG: ATP-binding cassette domain-containing protein [Microthrixaceae bacterium]